MNEEKTLEVSIKIDGKEARFSGTPDKVIDSILKFLTEVYPALEIVSRLVLSPDIEGLSKALEGIGVISPEGPALLVSKDKLSVDELIEAYLSVAYLGHKLGKLDSDALTITDLIKFTGSTAGSIAVRLSGLVSRLSVERVGKGKYRIATLGIKEFLETTVPKLKGGSR